MDIILKGVCGQLEGMSTGRKERGMGWEPEKCHVDEIEAAEGSWIQSDCGRSDRKEEGD